MTIKVGDKLPNATFTTWGKDGPQPMTTDQVFKGKTVALFAVPGAFTPTCSARHLPGFKDNAAELKKKGFTPVTTEIAAAPEFYFAEDYHQQYLAKNPFGYCGLGGTGVSCPIGTGVKAAAAH